MPHGAMMAESAEQRLLDRLPEEVVSGLTAEQKSAIAAAFGAHRGGMPVNLRISVPMLGWRFFIAVLGGHDRRSAARRVVERQRHPVRTAGNFLFVVAGAMAFYLAALAVFLVYSSVLEF